VTIEDEARKRAAERFRTLVEHAPEAIGVIRDGKTIYANIAHARFLGFDDPRDALGTTVLERIHPDDREEFAARVAVASPVANTPRSYRVVRRDGTVIVAEIVSLVVDDYDGAPARVAFLRDVTERSRLQSQLLQADRMISMGTLAAGVAHEINNPLAYAMANLEVLATRKLPRIREALTAALGELPPELAKDLDDAAEMVATAREGNERVRDIVRDLKTISRADERPSGPVDVRRVIEASLNIAGHELRDRARIVRCYDDGVPTVEANESRLGQVFLNLLLNAAQAIPPGERGGHEIRIAVAALPPSHVSVSIADTGAGMSEDVARRIFDPFFTTKPHGIGTGLGLSIAHGIVTGLGGTMRVETALGRGSTFFVDLPTSTPR
jgi:two-component system, NtrC family, sensor kinase